MAFLILECLLLHLLLIFLRARLKMFTCSFRILINTCLDNRRY